MKRPNSSLVLTGLLAFSLASCGKTNHASDVKGHFENSTSAAAKAYVNQQTIAPEWAPSQAVIVSSALMDSYGREDLVKAIVDAGVESVWVAVPRGSSTSTNTSTFSSLRQILGSDMSHVKAIPEAASGSPTVWARDWSPLGAKTENGDIHLLDLNYYPERPSDDSMARALESSMGMTRVSLPVYNEGGNFMTNSRGECLMTTRVTDANAEQIVSGDMILSASQIQGYYKDFGGCKKLTIFPRMPTEKTGHIDMWGKFLDDDTIVVNEISDATLGYATSSSEKSFAKMIQTFTNQRAADVAALGYKVIRLPMPLPVQGNYRSYTNSLLVNGTAIIPQYVDDGYADSEERQNYETKVASIYSSLGYKVSWIPADELIAAGGAIHCVTMQVPK
ncbi:MAG: agmatine deiminase family protein [Chitinophagaceae bacterium]|nr:agmatine deiminase family protein [Oligoflexus sp.]